MINMDFNKFDMRCSFLRLLSCVFRLRRLVQKLLWRPLTSFRWRILDVIVNPFLSTGSLREMRKIGLVVAYNYSLFGEPCVLRILDTLWLLASGCPSHNAACAAPASHCLHMANNLTSANQRQKKTLSARAPSKHRCNQRIWKLLWLLQIHQIILLNINIFSRFLSCHSSIKPFCRRCAGQQRGANSCRFELFHSVNERWNMHWLPVTFFCCSVLLLCVIFEMRKLHFFYLSCCLSSSFMSPTFFFIFLVPTFVRAERRIVCRVFSKNQIVRSARLFVFSFFVVAWILSSPKLEFLKQEMLQSHTVNAVLGHTAGVLARQIRFIAIITHHERIWVICLQQGSTTQCVLMENISNYNTFCERTFVTDFFSGVLAHHMFRCAGRVYVRNFKQNPQRSSVIKYLHRKCVRRLCEYARNHT